MSNSSRPDLSCLRHDTLAPDLSRLSALSIGGPTARRSTARSTAQPDAPAEPSEPSVAERVLGVGDLQAFIFKQLTDGDNGSSADNLCATVARLCAASDGLCDNKHTWVTALEDLYSVIHKLTETDPDTPFNLDMAIKNAPFSSVYDTDGPTPTEIEDLDQSEKYQCIAEAFRVGPEDEQYFPEMDVGDTVYPPEDRGLTLSKLDNPEANSRKLFYKWCGAIYKAGDRFVNWHRDLFMMDSTFLPNVENQTMPMMAQYSHAVLCVRAHMMWVWYATLPSANPQFLSRDQPGTPTWSWECLVGLLGGRLALCKRLAALLDEVLPNAPVYTYNIEKEDGGTSGPWAATSYHIQATNKEMVELFYVAEGCTDLPEFFGWQDLPAAHRKWWEINFAMSAWMYSIVPPYASSAASISDELYNAVDVKGRTFAVNWLYSLPYPRHSDSRVAGVGRDRGIATVLHVMLARIMALLKVLPRDTSLGIAARSLEDILSHAKALLLAGAVIPSWWGPEKVASVDDNPLLYCSDNEDDDFFSPCFSLATVMEKARALEAQEVHKALNDALDHDVKLMDEIGEDDRQRTSLAHRIAIRAKARMALGLKDDPTELQAIPP